MEELNGYNSSHPHVGSGSGISSFNTNADAAEGLTIFIGHPPANINLCKQTQRRKE